MTLAGKAYFDAVSKVGENAMASLVSRELGKFFIGRASKKKFNTLTSIMSSTRL